MTEAGGLVSGAAEAEGNAEVGEKQETGSADMESAGMQVKSRVLLENVAAAKMQRDEAWERWHAQCMAWYEVYLEVHGDGQEAGA